MTDVLILEDELTSLQALSEILMKPCILPDTNGSSHTVSMPRNVH